jgi:hypothetical protein
MHGGVHGERKIQAAPGDESAADEGDDTAAFAGDAAANG